MSAEKRDTLNNVIAVCKMLSGPIGKVDAMVVPFAHGGRDSRGMLTEEPEVIATRLRVALDEAITAIDLAKSRL